MNNFLGKDLGEKPKKFNDQLLIKLIICYWINTDIFQSEDFN